MTKKNIVGSKNDITESCPKFCKLGDDFFYFDEISKIRILQPKNASSEGCKKSPGKKSHQIKKWLKWKLSEILQIRGRIFLFWRNLKNKAATAEKRYFDNVY